MPFPERTRADSAEIRELCRRIALSMSIRQLSQSDVARIVGCQQSVVSEWVNADRAPSGLYLLRLPGALQVDGHWLLTGDGEMDDTPAVDADMPAAYARGGLAALARIEQVLTEVRGALLKQDDAIQRAVQAAAAAKLAEAPAPRSTRGGSRPRASGRGK